MFFTVMFQLQHSNLKLILLCSCALPFLREKVYGSNRLFSSSVTCHRFVFVGTICYFFKGMRGWLAYKMDWLDFPEITWRGENCWKKIREIVVKKQFTLPLQIRNLESMHVKVSKCLWKNNQTSFSDVLS